MAPEITVECGDREQLRYNSPPPTRIVDTGSRPVPAGAHIMPAPNAGRTAPGWSERGEPAEFSTFIGGRNPVPADILPAFPCYSGTS